MPLSPPIYEVSRLRVSIGGNWSPVEMARYFDAVHANYYAAVYAPLLQHLAPVKKRLPDVSVDLVWKIFIDVLSGKIDGSVGLNTLAAFEMEMRKDAGPLKGGKYELKATIALRNFYKRNLEAFHVPLKIARIQFNSPGFTDFTGIGSVVRELKEMIMFAIKWPTEKKERALALDKQKVELRAMELANVRAVYQIAKQSKVAPQKVLELEMAMKTQENTFQHLAETKQIIDAEIISD